jgi:hypothetical protein
MCIGSGKLSKFMLKDILAQKDLVLSTMKSAVLDGGTISLDLYLRVQRSLPTGMSEQYGKATKPNVYIM